MGKIAFVTYRISFKVRRNGVLEDFTRNIILSSSPSENAMVSHRRSNVGYLVTVDLCDRVEWFDSAKFSKVPDSVLSAAKTLAEEYVKHHPDAIPTSNSI